MARKDEQTFSTDLRSDISFMNRQMELRQLYRDFRSALDTFQTGSYQPTELDDDDAPDETTSSDTDLLLQEIRLIQSEAEEITSILAKMSNADKKRVKQLTSQVYLLQRIALSFRTRAEALLQ